MLRKLQTYFLRALEFSLLRKLLKIQSRDEFREAITTLESSQANAIYRKCTYLHIVKFRRYRLANSMHVWFGETLSTLANSRGTKINIRRSIFVNRMLSGSRV